MLAVAQRSRYRASQSSPDGLTGRGIPEYLDLSRRRMGRVLLRTCTAIRTSAGACSRDRSGSPTAAPERTSARRIPPRRHSFVAATRFPAGRDVPRRDGQLRGLVPAHPLRLRHVVRRFGVGRCGAIHRRSSTTTSTCARFAANADPRLRPCSARTRPAPCPESGRNSEQTAPRRRRHMARWPRRRCVDFVKPRVSRGGDS